jgi:hypothetical protein
VACLPDCLHYLARVLLIGTMLAGCSLTGRQLDIEVPSGFVGRAEIELSNPSCPPITSRRGRRVIALNAQGRACVSEEFPSGWISLRYFYSGDDGREIPHGNESGAVGVWPGGVGELVSKGRVEKRYFSFKIGPRP